MKLISLHMSNFRVFEDARIEFPAAGIVGIIGSNGHGKSTVLEAIAFALFGVDAIRGSKASIRWNRAPATRKTGVGLTFELAGETYHVWRSESDALLEHVRVRDGFAASTVLARAARPQ